MMVTFSCPKSLKLLHNNSPFLKQAFCRISVQNVTHFVGCSPGDGYTQRVITKLGTLSIAEKSDLIGSFAAWNRNVPPVKRSPKKVLLTKE